MLTFEEFIKLPYGEQAERYKELSQQDKIKARTSSYVEPISTGEAKELTDEEKKIVIEHRKKVRKQIEEYNKKHNK